MAVKRLAILAAVGCSLAACAPSSVDSPPPTPVVAPEVTAHMVVPAEFSVTDEGTCAVTIRTVPFGATSPFTVAPVEDLDTPVVTRQLGPGTPTPDGSCRFQTSFPRDVFDPTVTYRVTVESATHSLLLTWDYPGEMIRTMDSLPLVLTDKILRW